MDNGKLDLILDKLDKILNILTEGNQIKQTMKIEEDNEFIILKKLLQDWPAAVNPGLIVKDFSETDRIERANDILNMINYDISNSSFLDFGCGEGHIVKEAYNRKIDGFNYVGYDIRKTGNLDWEGNDYCLTTSFDKVKDLGPYDLILIYDVLDHIEEITVIQALENIKTLCKSTTNIFVRTHPWCSRHAAHLYSKFNKAFAHLVFTSEEIQKLGYTIDTPCSEHVIHPIITYSQWFEESGFKIIDKYIRRNPVEPYFERNEIIKSRIQKHWEHSSDKEASNWPVFQLEQSFLDFIIQIK